MLVFCRCIKGMLHTKAIEDGYMGIFMEWNNVTGRRYTSQLLYAVVCPKQHLLHGGVKVRIHERAKLQNKPLNVANSYVLMMKTRLLRMNQADR